MKITQDIKKQIREEIEPVIDKMIEVIVEKMTRKNELLSLIVMAINHHRMMNGYSDEFVYISDIRDYIMVNYNWEYSPQQIIQTAELAGYQVAIKGIARKNAVLLKNQIF